ncbi:hypothetical protein AB6A40_005924 [Gnathostoma spinigerum]|uniref:Brix domain-containing protein n=1 Tax=Gnathostoma spinigerum TaxID=75299 RepID=A0ABD6ESI0_9BILA
MMINEVYLTEPFRTRAFPSCDVFFRIWAKFQMLGREKRKRRKAVGETGAQVRSELMNESKTPIQQPHSLIFHRGKVGRFILRLERDLRAVMEPYTASRLKVTKANNLKDFIVTGAVLGVTHLIVLTRSEISLTMRLIRCPQGPTISFKVLEYTLAKDVLSSQRHPIYYPKLHMHSPLVILNGFSTSNSLHHQLVQSMIQNMFPSINIDIVKLNDVRRCVLVSHNKVDGTIDFRHYAIKAVPTGISKSTKKLFKKKVPDLSKYQDISQYFIDPGEQSESEAELEEKEVVLPEDLSSKGCRAGQTTNVKLVELGPRLKLELYKIEEGVDEGEVLYHSYITKSSEEIEQLRKELPMRKKRKERLRKTNELRVVRRLKGIMKRRADEEAALEESRANLIQKQQIVSGETVSQNQRCESYEQASSTRQRQTEHNESGASEDGKSRTKKKRRMMDRKAKGNS